MTKLIVVRNNKGFSLVELIVVIVILGVLVGITVPNLLGYIERAKEAKDIVNLTAVEQAFMIAVLDKSVTIVEGTIHYQPDGTLRGIGATLTEQLAQTFGSSGRTNGTGAGYKMPPLVSKKYRDRAAASSNRGLGYTFKYADTQKSYINVTRFGNFD